MPDYVLPYIDDVGVQGPASRYELSEGVYETIPENPGIRKFVWEHLQNVNRVIQHIKYVGSTFLGVKSLICRDKIVVIGHACTYEGQKPTMEHVKVIMDWEECQSLTEVQSFLGEAGVLCSYILGFAECTQPLQHLTHLDKPFEWGPKQTESMRRVKDGVLNAQCLKLIDYGNQGAIVLAVDTSYIAIGYYIYQEDIKDPKKHYYAKFRSITLAEHESRYSQHKQELFGLKGGQTKP